jgi:nucleoside-specific outer membrane channel protein Tsx
MKITLALTALSFTLATMLTSSLAQAEIWSNTEVQLQVGGEFENSGAPGTLKGTVTTFQHAGGWEYGDNFFFIDHSQYEGNNGLNDSSELYGEWYSNFSLSAITGNKLAFGPIKDIGVVAGFNYAPAVDSAWFLPGLTFALDIPGFAYATLNTSAYIHSMGADKALAGNFNTPFAIIDEETSFMVDFAWALPFVIGNTSWSFEGHAEYIDGRTQINNFGSTELESWVLIQPQIRLDVGKLLGMPAQRLFAGIEYQYWKNKLGTKGLDDNTAQFLAVWRF